ncbi:DUF4190 domain-containing protein [archaeon]|jgi:hypothetical protein|nr:DUF4190 domain-containing protein [archaeon]
MEEKWSGFAITGFVLSLLNLGLIGIVFSVFGLNDIKKTGKRGKGLGVAGLTINIISIIIGFVWLAIIILAISSVAGEQVLLNESYTIEEGMAQYQEISLTSEYAIDVDFTSDGIVDFYIVDYNEAQRLFEDEDYYYVEGDSELVSYSFEDLVFDDGDYHVAITNRGNSTVNTNLAITYSFY